MQDQHLHQCPKCRHIWMCDSTHCKADLHEYDTRCLVEKLSGVPLVRPMPVEEIHGSRRYQRVYPQNFRRISEPTWDNMWPK